MVKRDKTEVSLENSDISKVDSKIKENIEVVLETKPKEVKEEVSSNKDNKISLIDKILASAKEVNSEEKISLEKNEIKSTENTIVSTALKTKDSEKINPEKVVKSTIKESSETITLNTLKDETKSIIEDTKIEKKVLKVEEKSNDISDKKIVQQNQNEKIVDTSSLTLDKNSSIKENEDIKNKTVSQELPKTNSSKNETLDVNLVKESLNTTPKNETKNELASEKTLKEENSNSKQIFAKTEEPVQVAKKISLEEMMKNSMNNSDSLKQSKNDMVTSIYLSAQKKSLADNSLEVKSEAINTIKNAKSTKDIEKGAKALNLGLEKQEVITEKPVEESKSQKIVSSSTFDKLALFRNNVKDSLENKTAIKSSLDILSQNVVKSEDIEEKVVELSVNIATTPTLQNRIVAARQQMATMMSDLARTMYENYKPPVTAFRINLNPSSLGSIAIVLRNEQKNSLSISMNISNHSTKEIMIENQGSLRDSLSKTFEGASNFNLNFDASEESYNSANQENNSNENFENEFLDSSSIVSNKQNESNEEVEDNLNYM